MEGLFQLFFQAARPAHDSFAGIDAMSRLLQNPDAKGDNFTDNLLCFFKDQNMIVIGQFDNRIGSLLNALDEIGIEIKF